MAKIELDKYYTPVDLANHCWETVCEVIGIDNITHIIEPSCGNGAFYHFDKLMPDIGYDIEPEMVVLSFNRDEVCNESESSLDNFDLNSYISSLFDIDDINIMGSPDVIKADYLTISLPYKEGRLIIGNPPYGSHLNLAQKFFKKSVELGDYIAFILPISQLNNTSSMYEFDLVYSEDLGVRSYSGVNLHCCFNIYKRPLNGELNKRSIKRLEDITIYRQDVKDYENKPFDIRMCYWGNGSAGKILLDDEHYSAEYKIKINNLELKDEIISLLKSFDWSEYLNCIAMRKIQQYHIIDVLKDNIKGIK